MSSHKCTILRDLHQRDRPVTRAGTRSKYLPALTRVTWSDKVSALLLMTMSNMHVRPSTNSDGEVILSIMDANVLWFRTIGSTQWGPKLFSEDETMSAHWKGRSGAGDILDSGTTQTFVVEVDEWEEGKQGKRVAGFYVVGKRWPKYGECKNGTGGRLTKMVLVPDVDEPSLFINTAAIHPDMRGKGLGAAIVAHVKEIASKLDPPAGIVRLDTYGGRLGRNAVYRRGLR